MISWPLLVPKPWKPTSRVNSVPSGANSQPKGSAPATCRWRPACRSACRRRRRRPTPAVSGWPVSSPTMKPPGRPGEADLAVDVAAADGVEPGSLRRGRPRQVAGADRVDVVAPQPVALGAVQELARVGLAHGRRRRRATRRRAGCRHRRRHRRERPLPRSATAPRAAVVVPPVPSGSPRIPPVVAGVWHDPPTSVSVGNRGPGICVRVRPVGGAGGTQISGFLAPWPACCSPASSPPRRRWPPPGRGRPRWRRWRAAARPRAGGGGARRRVPDRRAAAGADRGRVAHRLPGARSPLRRSPRSRCWSSTRSSPSWPAPPGAGSQRPAARCSTACSAGDGGEADFVRTLLTGGLRQGALAGVMTDAVAKAADVPLALVRRAAMLSGDLGRTARHGARRGRRRAVEASPRGAQPDPADAGRQRRRRG